MTAVSLSADLIPSDTVGAMPPYVFSGSTWRCSLWADADLPTATYLSGVVSGLASVDSVVVPVSRSTVAGVHRTVASPASFDVSAPQTITGAVWSFEAASTDMADLAAAAGAPGRILRAVIFASPIVVTTPETVTVDMLDPILHRQVAASELA